MKRFLCLLLAAAMTVGLCACGKAAPAEEDGAAATTTTTAAQTPALKDDTVSLLAIGDGLVIDAVEAHLYDLFKAAGYKTVRLAILYAENSSVDTLSAAIADGSRDYLLRQNVDGQWSTATKASPLQALRTADWEYVVIQQAAADAGLPATYAKVGQVATRIRARCPTAAVYWQMTWAYQQNSGLAGFDQYRNDQTAMYRAVCAATRQKVLNSGAFSGVIPTGTAIQNLRTSTLGDTLTIDGIHLNDCGDYVAALTWYCYLTVQNADSVTYRPDTVDDCFDAIAASVNNAIAHPYAVTECK